MTLHGILWSPLIWPAACSELLVNCYFFHHSPITLCISKFTSFTSVILSLLPVLIDPTQYSTFFGNLKQQRIFFLYINQLSLLRSSFSICTFGFHRTLTCPTSLCESTGVRPLEPFTSLRIAPAENAENLKFLTSASCLSNKFILH